MYELDSVASQLRRYEENLVIVSGERPGRSWSEPVALIDILRSAVGEVAEYQRVDVHTDEEVALAPPAVADVIHLLAELIDNATTYSPSPSLVGVRAAMVAKGLAVEVEDRGLGLSEEDYASINTQLASPPQFDVVALADDLRLGMFVVSQLAHRHGITVTLRTSPYGGTTAIVLVPYTIVVQGTTPAPQGAASAVAGAVNGRPPASARSAVNGTAVPAALGARATSDTDTPEVPEIPEIPAAWETPEDWETQEDWNIPDTPEDWDTPEVWNTPTTWNIPETWDTPDRQTSWGRPALPSPPDPPHRSPPTRPRPLRHPGRRSSPHSPAGCRRPV